MQAWLAPIVRADERVVRALNAATHRWPAARQVVAAAAGGLAAGEVVLMLGVGATGHVGAAARMLLAVGLIYGLAEGMGRVWRRSRPFAQLADVQGMLDHGSERSFPSRHVASAVAMACIGSRADPRTGALMRLLAALLALSRVGAGLHYPSDVVVGAALGWLVGRRLR